MSRRVGKGLFSRKLRVFILLWIFLQNIAVYFGGNLLMIYYEKADMPEMGLPEYYFLPPEDFWIGGGGIIGGILILLLSHSLDIKSHFCIIRCIQVIGIGVIGTFYKFHYNEWIQKYWTFGMYYIFLMQGVVEIMSHILTPIYIMETICDRDLDEPAPFLLLVTTQLPLYLSSFAAHLLSSNRLFLTLGVGIFGGIFFLVFLFYIFLPKTVQDGKENEKSEYVDYWHLQFEEESGWLRPGASGIALCILTELCGSQLYQFYGQWTLRLISSRISSELLFSMVTFLTLLLALTFWSRERLPYFLMISTATITLSLFASGILLHGLEASGSIFHFAPITVYIIFTIAYSAGLGSLAKIITVLITPRAYRLNILLFAVVLSLLSHRAIKAAMPTLIQVLHPFGVFWLYSGIVLIGLLYIALAIIGQVGDRGIGMVPSQQTVEEFITQV